MYELMILAQLSRRPMHGYLIAKIIGKMIGPFRQVQWGALYPVLSRLVADGLIVAEEQPDTEEGRSRKVYAITDAGRAHLHDLLLDTEHHLGDYKLIFTLKVPFLHTLTQDERLHVCRHYAVYAQQHIDHLKRSRQEVEAADSPLTPAERAGIRIVHDHSIAHWTEECRWARELIDTHSLKEVS